SEIAVSGDGDEMPDRLPDDLDALVFVGIAVPVLHTEGVGAQGYVAGLALGQRLSSLVDRGVGIIRWPAPPVRVLVVRKGACRGSLELLALGIEKSVDHLFRCRVLEEGRRASAGWLSSTSTPARTRPFASPCSRRSCMVLMAASDAIFLVADSAKIKHPSGVFCASEFMMPRVQAHGLRPLFRLARIERQWQSACHCPQGRRSRCSSGA
ncbi:hypothetical protein, partial [Ralstonia solanacearum]|uniref:hypothetical protein n=1 Tax=Ralstonia solanacearum TaxID=305 RepID=UPI003D2934B8